MSASTRNRRSESGAQLLARLSSRPDLTEVDPFIFTRVTPSASQVIELYGAEGVGKTELAFHCIARICLPASTKNGIILSGLEAKVVYIDTELKFSIFRLAVILEKLILQKVSSTPSHPSSSKSGKSCQESMNEDGFEIKSENAGSDGEYSGLLRPQEIEEIVHESLGRVQVIRPLNSQQLLASLVSLETNLSEDPLYALLVIDSISAFYWLDRLSSPTSYQHLDSRMAPIAKMLKRYSSELGIPCLMTKSAYFSGKKSSDLDHSVATVSCNSSEVEKIKTSEVDDYSEYFGKSWSAINAKKIILNTIVDEGKPDDGNGGRGDETDEVLKKIMAYSVCSDSIKQYVFKEDLLVQIPV